MKSPVHSPRQTLSFDIQYSIIMIEMALEYVFFIYISNFDFKKLLSKFKN